MDKVDQMKCIKCGGLLREPRPLQVEGEVRGVPVNVMMDARECPRCGHRAIAGAQMGEFLSKTADAYRHLRGLLTSQELRRARARLGMSQQQFAEYLEVGSASVKRWELGEIQTPAMDQLVRLKTDVAFAEKMIARLIDRVAYGRRGARASDAPGRRRLRAKSR
jgi:putative zinc finger/helix-turn-helix YgiT family protein